MVCWMVHGSEVTQSHIRSNRTENIYKININISSITKVISFGTHTTFSYSYFKGRHIYFIPELQYSKYLNIIHL